MKYIVPDRKWVELELKLKHGMGEKWFLRSAPKVWKMFPTSNDVVLEGMKRDFLKSGYRFQTKAGFAHRWIRDLVSEKHRIVIHHCNVSACEKRVQKILDYQFFRFDRSKWRESVLEILEALEEKKKQGA